MSLRHKDPIIPKDGSDAFTNCKLGRKKYADVLTGIVEGYSDGFVLAINNPWGTGKSTFVKMWRQELKNQGYQTLYFNAWENDFQEEVIIALLSELEELKPKKGKTFNTLLEKTATFMTKALPGVAKGMASKVIGSEGVAEVIEAAAEFTAEQVEEQIAGFNKKKKGIVEFRDSLQAFVNEIDNDKPVVFIIDELDRCRPSYAVEVLEQIKHLFAVEGIVFALSIDKEQLGNAVRGFYGSDLIDADEYLRRFIDLEYNIPNPIYQNFFSYLYDYFEFDSFLNSEERLKYPKLQDDRHDFTRFASDLFYHSKLSLRQIEKIMAQIRICLLSFKPNQYFIPRLFLLLVYLKYYDNHLYKKIKFRTLPLQDLVESFEQLIKKLTGNNITDEHREFYLYLQVMLLKSYEKSFEYNEQIKLTVVNENGEQELTINSALDGSGDGNQFLSILINLSRSFTTGIIPLKRLITKIELLEQIEH